MVMVVTIISQHEDYGGGGLDLDAAVSDSFQISFSSISIYKLLLVSDTMLIEI